MRVPLSWLADYVDLTAGTREIARRLTIAGIEVDDIITPGEWDGIVVAHVEKVEPHPNADRLRLATVDIGNGEHPRVVCGAPNIAEGQNVAYAALGAKLIDGHTGQPTVLKAAKIRGVESQGMICSEKELGLSEEHTGILVLPKDAKAGTPLAEVVGDTIFDLDLTPNRPDWFSVLGIAREVAALTGQKWRDPPLDYEAKGAAARSFVKIDIEDPDLCARYAGAVIENVKIADSPAWMQDRLIAAGMRPINNVVDITNYVMLEMGQPLHAFDYEKVRGRQIIVRRARKGEKLTLLTEDKPRELSPDMLVIADGEGATAVAGVMGGGESEVTRATRTVLLESANFKGTSVRRTSQALKLRTDASSRFEKGLSRLLPPLAAARAVRLMVELCGGTAAQGLVDVFPGKAEEGPVTVTMDRLSRVLGLAVPPEQVTSILTSLGFGCDWPAPDRCVVSVPYWRTDVALDVDVIEEVARVIGYDQLPTTQLRGQVPTDFPQPLTALRERVKDIMASIAQEVITYSMSDLETLGAVLPPEELAINRPLRLANPLSRQWEYARTTLRHSLLQTLSANIRGSQDLISLFETARVYIPREDDLPHEVETLCSVVSGRLPDRWGMPTGRDAGFFEAKAHLDRLFAELRVPAEYRDTHDFAYLPGRTAEVFAGESAIGLIGEVHPRVTAVFDVSRPVAMFEINLEALLPHVPPIPRYEPVSQYPPVEQDLAVIVDADMPAGRVLELIRAFPVVAEARVFDVYTGDPIPAGKKSLAFAIAFQSKDSTLTDEDATKQRNRIIERLRRELGAEPRA
ncbi:MAG TPA: phenylalanine--tRNA ligase subunit beta [Dehalococcoidia bacterium]|nr:phenylalanine--tRNA ligase subunit beta [Dehalococcoidia bacterium]